MNKKGVFGLEALPSVVLSLMLAGIIAGVAAIVLASFQADTSVTTNTVANDSLDNSLDAVSNVTSKFPLLGTVIILGFVVIIVGGIFLSKKMA